MRLKHTARSILLSCCGIACFTTAATLAQERQADPAAATGVPPPQHMPETLRAGVDKLVIIAGPTPEQQDISGSYEKITPGLLGGISEGSRLGTLSKEIGGVNVNFPVPILTLPGAIAGGISGKARRDIQEFRDALSEDLASAANQSLSNDGLALDIYRELQRGASGLQPHLYAASTPIEADIDAVLYAGVTGVSLDVQGDEAILTTIAEATLRRASDGTDLYKKEFRYQDRDKLVNWTAGNNALWRDYANFSRHYLGREITADLFGRIDIEHRLQPRKSESLKVQRDDPWQASSRTRTPTLAWESLLEAGADSRPHIAALTEADIVYDVEIFDHRRPVYTARQLAGTRHTLGVELEDCGKYRWSVRPTYRIGTTTRIGHWMRKPAAGDTPNVLSGRSASAAPAYSQDFASLHIKC